MDIFELQEKYRSFDVEKALYMATSSRDFLLEVVQANIHQLKLGLRADGERIGEYRNEAYAKKKAQMNPAAGYGNVDLIYKGDFSKGIFAQAEGDLIEISSTDEKTADLESRYGDSIMGLMDESISDVNPTLQGELNKQVNEEINL